MLTMAKWAAEERARRDAETPPRPSAVPAKPVTVTPRQLNAIRAAEHACLCADLAQCGYASNLVPATRPPSSVTPSMITVATLIGWGVMPAAGVVTLDLRVSM